MQLTHAADVPVSERDQVFYNSRRRALGGVALIIIGAGAASYFIGLRQPGLCYYVLAVIAVGMCATEKCLPPAFTRPTGWCA